MALARTGPLRRELERALPERPFSVAFWDGSQLSATNGGGGPTFTVRSPRAIAHVVRAPGQLGLGRAYVSGDLDVDDLDTLVDDILTGWKPPALDVATKRRLGVAALRATGVMKPPDPPAAELAPRGRRHSLGRDRRSVRHHYDVSNQFFALFLDESMTYSCGHFEGDDDRTLEAAQEAKLDLVCRKLELQEGERVLDVGCGWGSFAMHAASRHGVHVTGITLSEPQARLARLRVTEAGLDDMIDIRVTDYRELGGERFDAIASIGMVEHVGNSQIDAYALTLSRLLAPGGRLLNHGIARLRHGEPEAGAFSERFVFPDAAPLHLSRVQLALEAAGFETLHVEGMRDDYVRTLTHWLQRLESRLPEAERLATAERVRVWRVYLRAARSGFKTGFTSIYQVRCRKP
jgi:cyclopropane-fatty-acyl-phospholipid synthase